MKKILLLTAFLFCTIISFCQQSNHKIEARELSDTVGQLNENVNISISVYPNPCKNVLTILSDSGSIQIEVFDICGNVVLSEIIVSNGSIEIDLSNLSYGIYFARMNKKTIKIAKL